MRLLPYFGSKGRMKDALLETIPTKETGLLISLFAGSAILEYEFARLHPQSKVICYDADPLIINFHQQVIAHPRRLHDRIEVLYQDITKETAGILTKDAYKALIRALIAFASSRGPTRIKNQRDAAAAYFIAMHYSFNGKFGMYANLARKVRSPDVLKSGEIPSNIEFRCADAIHVLRDMLQGNDPASLSATCLYLDPPYFLQDQRGYRLRGFDHESLRQRLVDLSRKKKTRWVLSYNDVPQVREWYPRSLFHIMCLPRRYQTLSRPQKKCISSGVRGELVISSKSVPMNRTKETRVRKSFLDKLDTRSRPSNTPC